MAESTGVPVVLVPEASATVTEFETDKDGKTIGASTTKQLRGAAARKALDGALDGPPTPQHLRDLAEKLPEKDEVQKATKAAMLAGDPQEEVKEKVKVVKASPDSPDTPSGYAAIKVQGVASHTERGELYALHKSARRWGYAPVKEA